MDQTVTKRDIVIARMGEIALKGLNRGRFEQRLMQNIRRRLQSLGPIETMRMQSRIWMIPRSAAIQMDDILTRVTSVFGVVSASPAWEFVGGMEEIKIMACRYMEQLLADGQPATFKVETRRGDKSFPLPSPAVSAEIGGVLNNRFDLLTVDVHQPDHVLHIEIRQENRILLYSRIVHGQRGLPVGISGKAMLLLSGGIDSPVAGYLMSSRGLELECIYFHSPPYTSERAKDKVVELASILSTYSGRIKLHIIHFTEAQLAIRDQVPADMMTIVMRRVMLQIAEKLAARTGCQALVTGESLGQVASQTVEALAVTNAAVSMPIFRPLVGLDEDAIVQFARRIDTFSTSILPYEDCCTLFVAKHPKIKPTLAWTLQCEAALDMPSLVSQALEQVEEVRL